MQSHYHWDHLGDPSTFPNATDIIVGPGFSEEFFPGGQPIPDCPILPQYYENRKLREISAAEFTLKFGTFPAFDYFGDGSFYLIDSPGVSSTFPDRCGTVDDDVKSDFPSIACCGAHICARQNYNRS